MNSFSSLSAVIGLWLGVSFVLWLGYRLFRRRDGSKRRKLVEDAIRAIEEGQTVFAAIRTRAGPSSISASNGGDWQAVEDGMLREDVRLLLNGIESSNPFFDKVNNTKKKLQQTFQLPDFVPLSEILQVRRDFWAASEVLLMEDIASLGVELADASAYDAFREEAKALLFQDAAHSRGGDDPVSLRLFLASEEANAFLVEVDKIIAAEREQNRLPRASEIIAGPLRLAQSAVTLTREMRYLLTDITTTAQTLARAMSSRGLKGAAQELRKVRADLPDQFATAFERAGGLARQGGGTLKRHYEFLLEAQELRARYAEVLSRAPHLSDKGKQFLQRLELEKRAEQFRETSEGFFASMRRQMVVGIAYLITGLQYVQAKVTPVENKQLAVRPDGLKPAGAGAGAGNAAQPASSSEFPLRAMLPAATYYNAERDKLLKRSPDPVRRKGSGLHKTPGVAPIAPDDSPRQAFGRLRDLVTGAGSPDAENRVQDNTVKGTPKRKKAAPRFSHEEGIMKTSFKDLLASAGDDQAEADIISRDAEMKEAVPFEAGGRASLLDRLSSVDVLAGPAADGGNGRKQPAASKSSKRAETGAASRGSGLFRRKRS